uniref:Uncharacterized protein n=1 Tax=Hordeum vulgare subsp. vulgare TaxID=112509 RepID=A0A8I6WRX9_HORVV
MGQERGDDDDGGSATGLGRGDDGGGSATAPEHGDDGGARHGREQAPEHGDDGGACHGREQAPTPDRDGDEGSALEPASGGGPRAPRRGRPARPAAVPSPRRLTREESPWQEALGVVVVVLLLWL